MNAIFFETRISVTQRLTSSIYRLESYMSQSVDCALYLEDYLLGELHAWDNGSV